MGSVMVHLCRMQISALLCCLNRFAFLPFPLSSRVEWGRGGQHESS